MWTNSSEPVYLTSELLLHYQRCRRRAFLDRHSLPSRRDPPNDYLQKLRQDSHTHHRQRLGLADYQQPDFPPHNWEMGAEATEQLMSQGAERIYRGVLRHEPEAGVVWLGQPDLLLRRPGTSCWGDWQYETADIKLSCQPKPEYRRVAVFHSLVLGHVQGKKPDQAWLFLRGRGDFPVSVTPYQAGVEQLLSECLDTIGQPLAPEVFIARSRCSLCPWLSDCSAVARESAHLSLLPGVTPSRYQQLQALSLDQLAALAATDPQNLADLPGFSPDIAYRLVLQAQAQLHNQPILVGPSQPLPQAPVELYFDIEAEPERDLVYLHGVLVVDHGTRQEQFHSLLAEDPSGQEQVWVRFLDLCWHYPQSPIFHFCPYEAQTVRRLAHRYHTPSSRVAPVLERMVDLHAWLTQHAVLPLESYALKTVARWLGFGWRDARANGAQSIYWYTSWLATGDRGFLEAILVYNEDDCRATYCLKAWLAQFLAEQV